MDITWYGHSCFRIAERNHATIVTDPYDPSAIGYSSLKLKTDIVTVSHDTPGHNYLADLSQYQYVLTGPGEYEIGGVFVHGIMMLDRAAADPRRNVVYAMEINGVTVAHLGDLHHVPTQSEVDELGDVDVVLVPVGGGASLHASDAAEVISLLEPSLVIPMHYKTEQTLLELDPVDRFLREMGVGEYQVEDTVKISATGLPEQTQVVVLAVKE